MAMSAFRNKLERALLAFHQATAMDMLNPSRRLVRLLMNDDWQFVPGICFLAVYFVRFGHIEQLDISACCEMRIDTLIPFCDPDIEYSPHGTRNEGSPQNTHTTDIQPSALRSSTLTLTVRHISGEQRFPYPTNSNSPTSITPSLGYCALGAVRPPHLATIMVSAGIFNTAASCRNFTTVSTAIARRLQRSCSLPTRETGRMIGISVVCFLYGLLASFILAARIPTPSSVLGSFQISCIRAFSWPVPRFLDELSRAFIPAKLVQTWVTWIHHVS
ncbi:hypothetical protein BCR44DRAFT_1012214 [Catenaria anguillulae PL171]|uniref:Uncharacterized protein n=1 Tax=Catenaria anguillulae PL171 TaxID=765915 RepID=A0A1Y2I4A9_9FUNG|nr:hypothetical protein BCR44DRAFT_1012214 [Catenaria anguillulae PL171]